LHFGTIDAHSRPIIRVGEGAAMPASSFCRTIARGVAAALACAAASASAHAQDAAHFYAGKNITFIVGYGAGASYDSGARLIARQLGKYIPGKPNVVIQNMPGAGSMVAANQLYNTAAKDGTVIAMFGRGLYLEALFGNPAVRFDPVKFGWIGSHGREVSVLVTGKDTPFKTVEDIRRNEIILAASGPGADTHSFALVLRSLLDAKVKIVSGFPGQAESFLAMDRGEVHGNAGATIGTLMALRPHWLQQQGLANFVVQLAPEKHPTLLQGVPLVMDYARNEIDRQALEMAFARQGIAYAFAAPPGIPTDRLAALRIGFEGAVKDPEFLADAQRMNADVGPVSGEDVAKIIAQAFKSSPEVLARLKETLTAKN
jgi:tripartite-type tricarboxylate transporter receptor subunit TctC